MTHSTDQSAHDELSQYLPEFIEGRLDSALTARVQAWLEHCAKARAELNALRQIMSIDDQPNSVPPAAIRDAFYRDLASLEAGTSGGDRSPTMGGIVRWLRSLVSPGRLAYSLALLLAGYLIGVPKAPDRPDADPALNQQLAQLSGEVQSLRLQFMQTQLQASAADVRLQAVRYGNEHLAATSQLDDVLSRLIANDPSPHVRLAAAQVLLNSLNQPAVEQRYLDLCLSQSDQTVQLVMLGMLNEVDRGKAKRLSESLLRLNHLSPEQKKLVRRLI